jgi:hypothetical protein
MKQIREPDHCFNPPIGRLILKSSGSAQAVRTVARTEPRGSTYYVLWPRKKKSVHPRFVGGWAGFAQARPTFSDVYRTMRRSYAIPTDWRPSNRDRIPGVAQRTARAMLEGLLKVLRTAD